MPDPVVLRLMIDQAPVAMLLVEGPDDRVRFANAAARALPGFRCLAPGEPLAATPAGRPFAGPLGAVRTTGCRVRAEEVEHTAEDGVPLLWTVEAVPLGEGGYALLTVHDVTAAVLARREGERRAEAAEAAQAELEALMQDVNHRVKNSLQLVSSLLTLQAMGAKDPGTRHQFQESCGRVGTIAQVHQRLYATRRYDAVAFGTYLREIAAEHTRCLERSAIGRAVAVSADDIDIPTDNAMPLALIVNELISNAMTHAYPASSPGEATVTLTANPDGTKRLVVADHGNGLPPDFDIARLDTLGLKVVRALTMQLRGKVTIADNAPGTAVTIDLPA